MIELTKQIAADDPIREVDWRWQTAKEIVADRRHISADLHNDVIARAAQYLRAKQNKRKVEDEAVQAAWEINQDRAGTKRLEMEMRLLAGQSLEDIGRVVGCSPEIVETYCQLFFDVRARLDATDYIFCRLLTPCRPKSSPVERLRNFVHRMGYLGSPLVADLVMIHFAAIRAAVSGNYKFRDTPMSDEKRMAVLAVAMTAPLTIREGLELAKQRVRNDLSHDSIYEPLFAQDFQERLRELRSKGLSDPASDTLSGVQGSGKGEDSRAAQNGRAVSGL